MKRNVLLLFLLIATFACGAQTFTIVNNSKSPVYFQLSGSDKNSCNQKYKSMMAMVNAGATMIYATPSDAQWTDQKPGKAFDYSTFNANYTDPSGACVSQASAPIGEAKCNASNKAVVNTSKCDGLSGNLHLSWSSKNGNVLVTIN